MFFFTPCSIPHINALICMFFQMYSKVEKARNSPLFYHFSGTKTQMCFNESSPRRKTKMLAFMIPTEFLSSPSAGFTAAELCCSFKRHPTGFTVNSTVNYKQHCWHCVFLLSLRFKLKRNMKLHTKGFIVLYLSHRYYTGMFSCPAYFILVGFVRKRYCFNTFVVVLLFLSSFYFYFSQLKCFLHL